MPESRSRSRKRKAATAASKGTSQDAEKDALSQSSAHPPGKEERYVPRFGPSSSAAKRVRTAGTGVAFFSCSQPVAPRAPSGSRVRRASDNATPLTTEGTTSSTQAGDSTAADEVTVKKTTTKDDRSLSEPATGRLPVRHDNSVNGGEGISGEDLDTQMQATETKATMGSIPGSFLTQSLPAAPKSEPQLQPPLSSVRPPCPPSPTYVGPLSPTPVEDTPAETEGMNLDLLDPLECNEDEEEEETAKDAGNDSVESTQMVEINEDGTALGGDEISLPALLADPLTLTPHRTHSTPLHTPPPSPTITLHPNLPQQLEGGSSVPEMALSPCQSLYNDNELENGGDGGSGKTVKGVMCNVGRVGECGEMWGGVEDAVVVGGSSGNLQVSTDNKEATQEDTGHVEEEEEDLLVAVREMMDLTAHDLLESQLLEEATVPSVSPLAMSHPHRERVKEAESAVVAEGSNVLRGLIDELSSLNQYVLACKRELEAQRRRRAAWIRSQSVHRGR